MYCNMIVLNAFTFTSFLISFPHVSDFPIELFKLPNCNYTDIQKRFSMTLRLYGPKCYEFLRAKVQGRLPASRTIQG